MSALQGRGKCFSLKNRQKRKMGWLQVGANVVALEQAVRVDFKTAVDKLQMREVLSSVWVVDALTGMPSWGLFLRSI